MQPHLHIIGHKLCPYVQRLVIVMNELDIAYERTNVDLDNKPDWLLAQSPTGNVPILIVNKDNVLFESGVICDYLADIAQHSLYPEDMLARARHRAWAAFGDQILTVFTHIIYRAATAKEQDEAIARIVRMLGILEDQLRTEPGLVSGEIQFLGVVFASVFRMLGCLKPLTKLDLFAQCPNVRHWSDTLRERASVMAAAPEQFDVLMRQFIAEKGSHAAMQFKAGLN